MIHYLDDTIAALLKQEAMPESKLALADLSLNLPKEDWREGLPALTLNCHLYSICENRELRTHEPLIQRGASSGARRAARRRPPLRIDCSYCITAWSADSRDPVSEEHELLSDVLVVLLKHPTIPREVLQGELISQPPPYPTVIAQPNGLQNHAEFWASLNHPVKPSLDYVVTLAVMLDDGEPVETVSDMTVAGGPKEKEEIQEMNQTL